MISPVPKRTIGRGWRHRPPRRREGCRCTSDDPSAGPGWGRGIRTTSRNVDGQALRHMLRGSRMGTLPPGNPRSAFCLARLTNLCGMTGSSPGQTSTRCASPGGLYGSRSLPRRQSRVREASKTGSPAPRRPLRRGSRRDRAHIRAVLGVYGHSVRRTGRCPRLIDVHAAPAQLERLHRVVGQGTADDGGDAAPAHTALVPMRP